MQVTFGGDLKSKISEEEFRKALQIDDRFEWPDGDFEFLIVWDAVNQIVRDYFGNERVDACERSGSVGNELTDAAWSRGLELAKVRADRSQEKRVRNDRRLAYRVRQAQG